MSVDTRYVPYTKETAICVDLAYGSMEEDIATEIKHANAETRETLTRILRKLSNRRNAIKELLVITGTRPGSP